ncbi:MAG TPA: hypothetical protein PKA06_02290 [Gemmatales bacterium]|nr:hypothetical protein [Gemmatales bacterium]HMP16015.1 hypothetical protein [Gemmatales bacterium]
MIIACPNCQGLNSYQTFKSGNTFDATFWTDGKLEAPMLQEPPFVAKCSLCHKCFWLADALEIGSYYPWNDVDEEVSVPEAWKQAAEIIEPEESDFYRLLQGGLAKDQDQEKTLRILTWWRTNDLFREELPAKIEDDPDLWPVFKMNLEALSDLLNDKDVIA